MVQKTDNAAVRALRITETLFRSVLDGMSNKEIVSTTGYSGANVCRDLQTLADAGWVRKLENGRWAISEKPVALMQMYQLYMSDLAERGRNFEMRVTAQARQMMP